MYLISSYKEIKCDPCKSFMSITSIQSGECIVDADMFNDATTIGGKRSKGLLFGSESISMAYLISTIK
jgi:hypothetical protein